jgi:O-Antigen ligase
MSHKRRDERRHRHRGEDQVRWGAVFRAIVLGGAAALVVITALVPSEAAVPFGAFAPLAAGWCLLLVVWAASLWLDDEPVVRVGWTEAAGAALVGWHSLAAVVSLGHTNGRLALNAHWLVLSYGIAAFLIRQALRTAEQARSLVAAMIWLATLLASLGLFQYFYSMPRQRRDYEQDPAKVLAASELPAETDSPQRELFENRLRSVEPLATFALTNSLAGFLAPWLLATMAIGLANYHGGQQRLTLLAIAMSALLLATCLVLTKSRSAYLAIMTGCVLLALYGRGLGSRGWRLDWRIPTGIAASGVVIGLVAVYFGGLDMEVLSEAPKSVLYRLEYWQATARLIADYPLLGSGPGNFQEAYAAYKLPQASEMVADPHNFLLEMWATAGTPAVFFLLALCCGFALDLAVATAHPPQSLSTDEKDVAPAEWIVLGGALFGLLIGPLVATAMGYPLDALHPALPFPAAWLLGLALLAATWWSQRAWIASGELSLAALVIPQIVLLINLLAAGAIVFPGVISTILVLAPTALFVATYLRPATLIVPATPPSTLLPGQLRPSRLVVAGVFFGSALIAVACLYTEYYPVLNGREALADALYSLSQRRYAEAEPKTVAAARADSLSPEPWRLLADLRLARWQATGREADRTAFVEAANVFRTLDPRHHLAWYTRGNWFLAAWRKSKQREDLDEALAAYVQGSKRYPQRALYHAQLAWTLHLAGQPVEARQAAEQAWKLDQQMLHREQKLNRQHVADPDISGEETAEQTVQRLRTASEDML